MGSRQLSSGYVNLIAAAIGAGYGLLLRLPWAIPRAATIMNTKLGNVFAVMTWGFLFGVPCVMGYLAVMTRCKLSDKETPGVAYWIFFPWVPTIAAMLGALALAWEGYICLLFAAPIMLAMASVGGVAAGVTHGRTVHPLKLSAVILLPVALMLLESRIPDPVSRREVETNIRIHAPAEVVWQNIIRVPAISPAELPPHGCVPSAFLGRWKLRSRTQG